MTEAQKNPSASSKDADFAKQNLAGDKPTAAQEKGSASVAEAGAISPTMAAFSHVPVEVEVVLGRTRLPIGNVLKLGRGAVVEIDRKVGEQVDIHINHRPVARGELIIVDEDRLGVTLTEIINVQNGLQ